MSNETAVIQAQHRSIFGKKIQHLRDNAQIPAVVYGPGSENEHLVLDARMFEKIYRHAGNSTLVELACEGQAPAKVLIHEVQRDQISGKPLHVDFYRVNMKEKLTTHVPLNFVNESRAVKEKGGILVKNMTEVEVRCLPGDLVSSIDVSLEPLNDLESMISIRDLALPRGVELTSHYNPDDIVAIVTPPVSEEELKKMEQEGVIAAPAEIEKSEERGKKEEE